MAGSALDAFAVTIACPWPELPTFRAAE